MYIHLAYDKRARLPATRPGSSLSLHTGLPRVKQLPDASSRRAKKKRGCGHGVTASAPPLVSRTPSKNCASKPAAQMTRHARGLRYLETSGLRRLLKAAVQQILLEQPADPVALFCIVASSLVPQNQRHTSTGSAGCSMVVGASFFFLIVGLFCIVASLI